jgi:hypothetical protein
MIPERSLRATRAVSHYPAIGPATHREEVRIRG